jgi:hypothetical protein
MFAVWGAGMIAVFGFPAGFIAGSSGAAGDVTAAFVDAGAAAKVVGADPAQNNRGNNIPMDLEICIIPPVQI